MNRQEVFAFCGLRFLIAGVFGWALARGHKARGRFAERCSALLGLAGGWRIEVSEKRRIRSAAVQDAGAIHMSDTYIQNLFAERIGGRQYGKSTAIYKFEKIKRAKRAALAANPGAEIIDMGVGEPDEMAFPEVVASLARGGAQAGEPRLLGQRRRVLKAAAARYLERVCGVPGINPETEVLHSIGSKAALSILPAALINPGDYVLMTVPGYPVFGTHAKYYGGLVHNLPLTEANHFLPDLDSIPAEVLGKAKVLVLNYPNNPDRRERDAGVFRQGGGFCAASQRGRDP
jgi:LL-diaminopimelate aminotransferase